MATRRVAKKAPPINFSIKDLGGIAELDVRCEVGITELVGRNGAGKSSAIAAISKASGAEIPVEVRDGADEGSVTGNGVSLTIRRIARTTGRAEIELAEGGPLADLIDGGGYADPAARAKARVRALLRLERLPVTEETIGALASDPEVARLSLRECQDNLVDDLLEAAEKVRRTAHGLARVQETGQAEAAAVADVHEKRATEAVEETGGTDRLVEIPADDASANAAALRDQLAVTRADAQRRAELEAQQAEIRGTLGERPDPKRFDGAKNDLLHIIELRRTNLDDLRAQRAKLDAEIASVEQAHTTAVRDAKAIELRISEAQAEATAWDQRAGLLSREISGPVAADVEKLERAVTSAAMTASLARISEQYRADREAAKDARQKADDHALRGEFLRTIATTVQDRLGQLLATTAAQGFTVNAEGRLCVVDGKKVLDFETRQSEGQRIAKALEVAARTYAGKVVPLDGRYWQALDPEHKADFAAKAADLGLFVITERASEGSLIVNHLPAKRELAEAVSA